MDAHILALAEYELVMARFFDIHKFNDFGCKSPSNVPLVDHQDINITFKV